MTDHDSSTLCRACDHYRDGRRREMVGGAVGVRAAQVPACRMARHPVWCQETRTAPSAEPGAADD